MRPLPKEHWARVARDHEAELAGFIFPRAVLQGLQEGAVFTLSPDGPESIWVINRSGFMQLVGAPPPGAALHAALTDPMITGRYLLWYAPSPILTDTLRGLAPQGYRERVRVRHAPWAGDPDRLRNIVETLPAGFSCVPLTMERLAACDAFDLQPASRFWSSATDLLRWAGARLVLDQERPVAICYAAAIAGGQAELDVMTLPAYRGRGLAKAACAAFILGMQEGGMSVVWDAFATNDASMHTAAVLGFREQRRYTFTTFTA